MIRFEYLEPTTIEEAIAMLSQHGEQARVLAGGTDLLIRMKARQWRPQYVVNIKGIPGLSGISQNGGALSIGALTTVREIETSPLVKQGYPALAYAASQIGSIQVRNSATVGGNLCNAAPSAELAPPLLVLGASARIRGPQGERSVPLEEFFTGPGRTVLGPGELLVALEVPAPVHGSSNAYLKHSPRRAMDIAVVGAAAWVLTENGICRDCRIALGAVAPTPLRARNSEAVL
ncbi:MAG TPA: xanthine dehydrogenase family protein subunit M, partial [Dehalococcoidia bacterium]|nr:xanthine dehydrogenase family protein subunit M [Dehalococcoidia bacterium]